MNPFLRRAASACLVAALAFAAPLAAAQQYPARTIRVVVPFPPGAFNDTLGRLLAQEFQKSWGQPAIVENRPGAGSAIGADLVAKSPADGYTLLIVAFPFALINSLHARMGMDVTRDFAPIAWCGATPNILVVNPSVPANSVGELLALARAKPGTLNYASTGTGSSNHLSMELFKSMTNTDIVHVPYKGSAPAVTDLLGGQINIMFDNTPNVLPHIRAGKMRALGVTTLNRSSFTPELPTVAESGVPGYEVTAWFGMVAPAGTPKDVVAKLNAEVNRVLALPETKERFLKAGVEPTGGSPEEFARHIRTEVTKWAKVVKDADIKAD
jgi:tripartite-type tricarboxylate transporter receptor subunit TctC